MAVEAVPAATIILLRGEAGVPEVLMIQRHARSEILPDLYAFPGGRVEDEDHALAQRLTGLAAEEAEAAFGDLEPERAVGFVVAAIRETFEEVGILLARPRGGRHLLGADRLGQIARHRLEMQAGRMSFRELVELEDLELAGDTLAVHAHWITPEFLPRRFDTFFFTALAPPGQLACHDGIETSAHLWIRPEDALEQLRARRRRMIFPTAVNLESLKGFSCAREAVEASHRRAVVAVMPELVQRDGVPRLVIPAAAGYSTTEAPVD